MLGCIGGLLGWLAARGRNRRFVLITYQMLIGLCALALLGGLVTAYLGQPYGVVYPLILIGVIGTAVFGGSFRTLRRRYEQLELRKMKAKDTPL